MLLLQQEWFRLVETFLSIITCKQGNELPKQFWNLNRFCGYKRRLHNQPKLH